MSTLINASIRVDKLPKEKFIKGKDGAVYYNLTIAVNDETRYGNNVGIMDSQTKEEREAKKTKLYLGNGKVVWTDYKVTLAERIAELTDKREEQTTTNQVKEETADLPF